MRKLAAYLIVVFFTMSSAWCGSPGKLIICSSNHDNDILQLLSLNHYELKHYTDPLEAIEVAPEGGGVLIFADGYPLVEKQIEDEVFEIALKKDIKLYIEFASHIPGLNYGDEMLKIKYERGIVTTNAFGNGLPEMSVLGLNGFVQKMQIDHPLIVAGKVAGVYKAEYGIDDVTTYPLLFEHKNMLVATTKLSGYSTGRFGPKGSWEQVWSYILNWVLPKADIQIDKALVNVAPMYTRNEKLPADALPGAIMRGADWFYNGRFLIDKTWEQFCKNMQMPGAGFGPYLDKTVKTGDGSLGIIEGHGSHIYPDGTQQYRYCNRADDNGQVAFALAITNEISKRSRDAIIASNLLDFLFYDSQILAWGGDDPSNPAFGLMGWSDSEHSNGVFYGDDNARAIIGALGASASLNIWNWDREILQTILANFRTTGIHGFRGSVIQYPDLKKNGWKHYFEGDMINPHPHFESWMWAVYLWLYDKTGYQPLLQKTKNAIQVTMDSYPDKWGWTNGIQQERARMILPLAWLVRVEDAPEHRKWLDLMVDELLVNQQPCGAIIEELGAGKGFYGRTVSNAAYGSGESPLIFRNGDPIADMLYTSNFALFSLNEAAKASNNPKHKEALQNLADFLIRIQIKSEKYDDLHGGWFRAFDFEKWDYWASNADHGWGAWGTHTGWTQATIVSTLALIHKGESFWEHTSGSRINSEMNAVLKGMYLEVE